MSIRDRRRKRKTNGLPRDGREKGEPRGTFDSRYKAEYSTLSRGNCHFSIVCEAAALSIGCARVLAHPHTYTHAPMNGQRRPGKFGMRRCISISSLARSVSPRSWNESRTSLGVMSPRACSYLVLARLLIVSPVLKKYRSKRFPHITTHGNLWN